MTMNAVQGVARWHWEVGWRVSLSQPVLAHGVQDRPDPRPCSVATDNMKLVTHEYRISKCSDVDLLHREVNNSYFKMEVITSFCAPRCQSHRRQHGL